MALVEIHGQNESQSLTDAATQRQLLDGFAGLGQMVGEMWRRFMRRAKHAHWRAYRADLEAKASARIQEFLTHAIAELEELSPKIGEEVALADERLLLMNAEKIIR